MVLITGDYWHGDFTDCIQHIEVPVTMVQLPRLLHFLEEQQDGFDLIIVAQSRRGQLSEEDVMAIRKSCPSTPIVALLGSWCEGEERSGEAIPGVTRVYWHQWRGRLEQVVDCLAANGISKWHASPTATRGDVLLSSSRRNPPRGEKIGVSAWTLDQYEMLGDSLKALGWQPIWVEQVAWQAENLPQLSGLVIDGNSLTPHLMQRIEWARETVGSLPMILILNFPRSHEVQAARELQIAETVSKPFELDDLGAALARALDRPELNSQRSTTV